MLLWAIHNLALPSTRVYTTKECIYILHRKMTGLNGIKYNASAIIILLNLFGSDKGTVYSQAIEELEFTLLGEYCAQKPVMDTVKDRP